MKALEILKYAQSCPFARMMTPFKDDDFIIAIKEIEKLVAELEALQDIILEKDEALDVERLLFKNKLEALENRSCESCKYSKDIFSYTYPLCTEDENNLFQIHNIEKLKCNKWKNKC